MTENSRYFVTASRHQKGLEVSRRRRRRELKDSSRERHATPAESGEPRKGLRVSVADIGQPRRRVQYDSQTGSRNPHVGAKSGMARCTLQVCA
ncbi:hypothetical protein VTO42DRAFT_1378 [Malbranchea cinnamomea]